MDGVMLHARARRRLEATDGFHHDQKLPMLLHAQTTHANIEGADPSNVAAHEAAGIDAVAEAAAEDGGTATDAIISIELNFNAFADNVPPTRHAKRVASNTDPTVQDFADQALELATLRAELKRLTRDHEVLQQAMRSRDARLQILQDELALARSKSRDMTPSTGDLSATQKLPIPHVAGSATLQRTPPTTQESPAPPLASRRQLIPVDHGGETVLLSRDIMTIGRTPQNDICIPSHAVSRDHARLLMGPRSVTIVDMNSANGCFVNDEPVKRQQLRDGDVLRIGDRSYRYSC